VNPNIAVNFVKRFLGYTEGVEAELVSLCTKSPICVMSCPEALPMFIQGSLDKDSEEMRVSNFLNKIYGLKHLLRTYVVPAILDFCFAYHSGDIIRCAV
jgi:hypothetical protein